MIIEHNNRYYLQGPRSFFKEVKNKGSLTWKGLSQRLIISKSQIKKIINGERTIKGRILLDLLKFGLTNKNELYPLILEEKRPNWGQIKGGKITYNKVIGKYINKTLEKYFKNLNTLINKHGPVAQLGNGL